MPSYAVKWTKNGVVYDYTGLYELDVDETTGQICMFSSPNKVRKWRRMLVRKKNGQVYLSKSNVSLKFTLHDVWMRVVVGPPPEDGEAYTVDHIDRDHSNNAPSNLRWASKSTQAKNKNPYKHAISWQPFEGDDEILEFKGRFFIARGYELRKDKSGSWKIGMGRKTTDGGYNRINFGKSKNHCRLNRVIAFLFGDSNGVKIDSVNYIKGVSLEVDHIDHCKSNDNFMNLIVCTHKENTQATHDRGKSNHFKKRVYSQSVETGQLSEYDSTIDASAKLGLDSSNISKVCLKKLKTAGGYYLSYTPFE